MARLKAVGARIGAVAPRVAGLGLSGDDRSAARMRAAPWRKNYYTARWRALRAEVLRAARFTCAMCGVIEGDTSRLVADHVMPHRGDEELFWDRGNLQCLCAGCHNGRKQRQERRGG